MNKKIIRSVEFEGSPELTPFERFCAFTRQILSVPKKEIDRREAEWRERRTEQRAMRLKKTPPDAH